MQNLHLSRSWEFHDSWSLAELVAGGLARDHQIHRNQAAMQGLLERNPLAGTASQFRLQYGHIEINGGA
jgi:hypothetical protein